MDVRSATPETDNGSHTHTTDSVLIEHEQMMQAGAFTTKVRDLVAWGRKNSLWPLPYGTACCGIELMSVMGPKYDLARFGAEVVRFSPRQSDLLIVAGTISEKMAPILVHIYSQMLEPKFVLSID